MSVTSFRCGAGLLFVLSGCAPTGGPPLTGAAGTKAAASGYGVPNHDASCGWAAVQVAVALQYAHDQAYDSYIGALLPVRDLPIPAGCAGDVAVYVESVSTRDFRLCAWVTRGAGRSFCGGPDGEVHEAEVPVITAPVEPATDPPRNLQGLYPSLPGLLLHQLGVDGRVPPVTIGADGRVVAALSAAQSRACAMAAVVELGLAEAQYDAAFDSYSTDYAQLGYTFDLLLSCPAYVAVRIASASEHDFRVESRIVEGDLAGLTYAVTATEPLHFVGRGDPTREILAAAGWWLGEAPPL